MQTSNFDPLLTSAAAEVLESMCFISVAEHCEEPATADAKWVAAKLHFQGPFSGDFGLCAPLGTAQIIASNFLGEDESGIDPSQIVEVLCELANMICGSFLSRFESKGVYDLSPPVLDDLSPPVFDTLSAQPQARATCQTLQLDEGIVRVWLNLEIAS